MLIDVVLAQMGAFFDGLAPALCAGGGNRRHQAFA
jgi:hypothetical protein